jgi:hypothetical protein
MQGRPQFADLLDGTPAVPAFVDDSSSTCTLCVPVFSIRDEKASNLGRQVRA